MIPGQKASAQQVMNDSVNDIYMDGTNELADKCNPDFYDNAWNKETNPYSQGEYYGQCTWFAWGRFYEIYGYSPGFLGDGNSNVDELLAIHPDTFIRSDIPIVGSIGSSDYIHDHAWIVVGIDEDGSGCTIQEGNLDLMTNTWEDALLDWRQKHYTWEEIQMTYGNAIYANPVFPPERVSDVDDPSDKNILFSNPAQMLSSSYIPESSEMKEIKADEKTACKKISDHLISMMKKEG